jgi:hypothetical protein
VHHNSLLTKSQLDATVCSLIYFTVKSLYMFRVVASGIYNLAKLPIIFSYSLRCRVFLCMDLVTHHKKRYTCAHYTPILRENFLLTPLFKTLLWVADWNVPCGQSLPCLYFCGDSWPYLSVCLVLTHPMTSLAAQILMLFNPLALELDIYSLAHHLCKMWIFCEPRRLTLGNTRHFVEE